MKQVIIIINILLFNVLLAQKNTILYPPQLDSLLYYENIIKYGENDFEKLQSNEYFNRLMIEILSYPDAHNFNFDTIKLLSVLKGEDFLLITWGVPLNNGKTIPYGLTLKKLPRNNNYKVVELKNVKDSLQDPEQAILKNGDWYGAIYYQIIPIEVNDIKYYTLLGWDGENGLYQSKVIDILGFSYNGQTIFGKRMFKNIPGKKNPTRLIFRYSKDAVMTLRYERQSYEVSTTKTIQKNKPKNSKNYSKAQKADKKIVKTKRYFDEMIIYNSISPLNKFVVGQYQFYYPNAEDLVGLQLIDNKWVFRPNIDARNAPDVHDNYDPTKKKTTNKVPPYH
jgi:hypothetical protein